MKKLCLIYDDIKRPETKLKELIGDSKFSEIIFKRNCLKKITTNFFNKKFNVSDVHILSKKTDVKKLEQELKRDADGIKIIHFYSFSSIVNYDESELIIKKLLVEDKNFFVLDNKKVPLFVIFSNLVDYLEYLEAIKIKSIQKNPDDIFAEIKIQNHIVNISKYDNLMSYLAGAFNARFFNFIECDKTTVTKKSKNKRKIQSEFQFYYVMPEDLRYWFVKPYDLQENNEFAWYKMDRYKMADMSVRWVHKAVTLGEIDLFFEKAFCFFKETKKKPISDENMKIIKNDLYIKKVDDRINELKQNPKVYVIEELISSGTNYNSIDEIFEYYKKIYFNLTKDYVPSDTVVIGHGDFCLSNIFYNKELEEFKLIDPKGGLCEEDLWTDKYYDVAKLSHSICGNYDFFNCSKFIIKYSLDKQAELIIEKNSDEYIDIFKKHLEKNGFDYNLVRLYEASLFLSMLPLHMDQPEKVFAFILNSLYILKKLELNSKMSLNKNN